MSLLFRGFGNTRWLGQVSLGTTGTRVWVMAEKKMPMGAGPDNRPPQFLGVVILFCGMARRNYLGTQVACQLWTAILALYSSYN